MSEMRASKVVFPPQKYIATCKVDWLSAMPDNLIADLREYLLYHEEDIYWQLGVFDRAL